MPSLDVFRGDAFGVLSLTTAMNKMPYVPKRLGALGLFRKRGINTTHIMVEEQNGKLMIVPSAARGSSPNVMGGKKRSARTFTIIHLPLAANVMADDVQNVRSFGSESEMQAVAEVVNDKLADMRTNFEATHEYHRIGAIQGILLDADGTTTLYNWFQEFGQTEQTVAIDWSQANSVKRAAHDARRKIEDALGMDTYTGIRAMVSPDVMDALVCKDEIKNSYQYQQSQFLREAQARSEFTWGGITWEEYRGSVPTHDSAGAATAAPFIPANTIRFFPEGTQNCFEEIYGPANFRETVNTKGLATYAKQMPMDFDMGIKIFGQSNPLIMCTRPSVLVKCVPTGTAPTFFASLGAYGPDGPSEKDMDDLKHAADQAHKIAEHTKSQVDIDAAANAKRSLAIAKLDQEETAKRKKSEMAALIAAEKEAEKIADKK
jgi:hypothetical protein